MQAVIDFETKIAEITSPPEDRRDDEKLYHPMLLREVQRIAPFVSEE
jgi:endothelin-converting enzyme